VTQVGSSVLELVAVMDRLRSPGGCPWDAQQTHTSLVEYLLEETYESIEALETDDRAAMIEELGDLLLQVVFHARIGQEADNPWNLDDVACGITTKLMNRHPHIFSDTDEPAGSWAQLKAREKGRTSALDGVPLALPALALAQKSWRRAMDADLDLNSEPTDDLGDQLLALAVLAESQGLDAEAELRKAVRGLHRQIRDVEVVKVEQ